MAREDEDGLIEALGFVCLYAAYLEEAIDDCERLLRGKVTKQSSSKKGLSSRRCCFRAVF
jgi:hypothetical protein